MKGRKSIVVTGASAGIGAALCRAFAADGHRLFICARRGEKLAEVARDLPGTFHAPCDVSAETDVVRFFRSVAEHTPHIDGVIHCAGSLGPVGRITETDAQTWLAAIHANLYGAFLVAKHAIPLMPASRRPRIVLLSGGGAFDPMPHLSAYGVAKAGIVRLAETLAIELAPDNIAVNVLAPGFVDTHIFDPLFEAGPARGGTLFETVRRLRAQWKDSDIDRPIACARFLLSDAAAPLTGKTISARFDPWDTPEFHARIKEIAASGLYTTQRKNLADIDEPFVTALAKAAMADKTNNASG
jgi:ketoreductase